MASSSACLGVHYPALYTMVPRTLRSVRPMSGPAQSLGNPVQVLERLTK